MPDRSTRLKALAVNRVAFVPAGDNPEARITMWKADPETTWTDTVLKRSFSQPQRAALASKGMAIPVKNDKGEVVDGRYPIENVADLRNAIQAIGRVAAGDRGAVVAHIKKRAAALGQSALIPDTFKEAEGVDVEKAPKKVTPSRWKRLLGIKDELDSLLAETADDPKEESVDMDKILEDIPEEQREVVQKAIDAEKERADEAERKLAEATKATGDEPDPAEDLAKALAEQPEPVRKAFEDLRERTEKAEQDAKTANDAIAAREEADRFAKAEADAKELGVDPAKLAEARKAAPEATAELERQLRGQAEANRMLTRTIGKDRADESPAEEKLNALAKERAKADGTTEAVALTKVIDTAEGKALHREAMEEANER